METAWHVLVAIFCPRVLSTFLLQVKPGNKFDYFLILAELVWLDLAYAWSPPVEMIKQVRCY